MTLNYTSCFYHPDKVAVTVCERCRRPICLEDKHSSNYSSQYIRRTSGLSYLARDYCKPCYDSMINTSISATPIKFAILGFILFFFMIIGIFSVISFGEPLPFIFIFFFIFFGLFIFVFLIGLYSTGSLSNKSTRNAVFNNNQQNFGNYTPEKNTKQAILESQKNITISCYECGSYLTLEDKFCPSCGDSTHDELVDYYKVQKN